LNLANTIRRHASLLAVLAVAAPLYFVWTWTNEVGDIGNDAVDYLLMAAHFSPYASAGAVTDQAAAFSRFPPVYPLILSWLGAAGPDLHRAHIVTTSFLLLALVAWYAWLRRQQFAPAQAALLALAFAALPGSWQTGLNLHSEYPYLLWSVLALLFLSRYEKDRRDEDLYAAALLVAVAALTRTVGVVLFAPLLLAALRGPRRSGLLALVMAASPLLIWHLLHRPRHSYGTAVLTYYSLGSLQFLRAQISTELPALRSGFEQNFSQMAALLPFADFLGVLCAAAAAWRAARLRADGIYLLAYLAVLLIWPYPNVAQRLVWVVLPLFLVRPLLAWAELRVELARARAVAAGTAAIAGTMLLLAFPAIAQTSERFLEADDSALPGARGYEGWYAADPRHATHRVLSQLVIVNALRQIPELVPQGDCVISPRTDLVNYYGQRRSVFPPLNSVPDPYFMEMLRATGCHYVFMYNAADGHFPVPLHPLQRLAGHFKLLSYVDVPDPASGEAENRVICILARLE